jgi:hypothetical protein
VDGRALFLVTPARREDSSRRKLKASFKTFSKLHRYQVERRYHNGRPVPCNDGVSLSPDILKSQKCGAISV